MHQLTTNDVRSKIVRLPGRKPAMMDRDLAKLYGTDARHLNQAVKRNSDWFEDGYYFHLTEEERTITICDNSHYSGPRPFAYTHHGCNAAAFILRTPQAKEHRRMIIAVFSEIERAAAGADSVRATAGESTGEACLAPTEYNLQLLESIATDAAKWRLSQLPRKTLLSDRDIKNWLHYRELNLKYWEISRLLNISTRSFYRYQRMLDEALASIRLFNTSPEPRQLNLLLKEAVR
jgi:hypothetical protein